MEEITHASIRFLLYGILFGMMIVMFISTIQFRSSTKSNNKLIDNMNKMKDNGTTKSKG